MVYDRRSSPNLGLFSARFAGAAAAGLALAIASASGCASTEFFYEGPGQPSERASGAVPPGSIGVCKRPGTTRPPLVAPQIWEDARECNARTPPSFIRLGYGQPGTADDAEATKRLDAMMQVLREAQKRQGEKAALPGLVRQLREQALKDASLKDRVFHPSAAAGSCDFGYLFDTMSREREKLEGGDRCSAEVYDPKVRAETCLFDTSRDEVVWLTSAWPCVSQTVALGAEASCHRLCSYDDYCARQVSCAAPDFELLLCSLGVCLPERRDGF